MADVRHDRWRERKILFTYFLRQKQGKKLIKCYLTRRETYEQMIAQTLTSLIIKNHSQIKEKQEREIAELKRKSESNSMRFIR